MGKKPGKESGIKNLIGKTTASFHRQYSEKNETLRLERELAEDDQPPPQRRIDRVRRKGEHILHSKHILMAIVLLNLVDCVLVLGELILDIHYIKDILETSDVESQTFIDTMQEKYPTYLHNHDLDHMGIFFDKIQEATCEWNGVKHLKTESSSATTADDNTTDADVNTTEASKVHGRKRRSADNAVGEVTQQNVAHAHSIWEDIAHGLHKASIAILAILFVENILKILCMGRRFFKHYLEVFDAVIVIVSFALDLAFLKGLTVYRIQDGIFILSFLLPWRVIRVVNSLMVAVLDHEHFRLKMMYKKQKSVSAELAVIKDKESQFEFHLKKIERFCLSEGIPQWKVKQQVHIDFNKNNSTVSSMASYALNGMAAGFMGQCSKSLSLNVSKAMFAGELPNVDLKLTNEKEHSSIHDTKLSFEERTHAETDLKMNQSQTNLGYESDVSSSRL